MLTKQLWLPLLPAVPARLVPWIDGFGRLVRRIRGMNVVDLGVGGELLDAAATLAEIVVAAQPQADAPGLEPQADASDDAALEAPADALGLEPPADASNDAALEAPTEASGFADHPLSEDLQDSQEDFESEESEMGSPENLADIQKEDDPAPEPRYNLRKNPKKRELYQAQDWRR